MGLFSKKLALLASLTLMLCQANVFAFELRVYDQKGMPVKDAFVAIPEGAVVKPASKSKVMDQIDRQFVPHVLAVAQGESVVFPNSDNIRHHVYSFSEAKKFEIQLYEGVPEKPILFDQAGLVALGCNIHDSMLGYILVSPWPEFAVTDAAGKVEFEKSHTRVAVWHPWLKGLKEPKMVNVTLSNDNKIGAINLDLTEPQAVKQFKGFRKRYDD